MLEEKTIKSMSEVAKEVAKPFYNDAVHPAAKEVGQGLASVARMINAGVYLAEDSILTLTTVLRMAGENLLLLPPEEISLYKPRVTSSAIEESRFSIKEPDIQEMFAKLISSSMNLKKEKYAHPAFVSVIKQINSDEAKFLKFMSKNDIPVIEVTQSYGNEGFKISQIATEITLAFEDAECEYPELDKSYIENLRRLGIIKLDSSLVTKKGGYDRIFNSRKVNTLFQSPHKSFEVEVKKTKESKISYTGFVYNLVKSCIND